MINTGRKKFYSLFAENFTVRLYMEVRDAILTRRSVRNFTDYYVTDDEIDRLLEAARWAPSWSNTQSWEFIIIRDRALSGK